MVLRGVRDTGSGVKADAGEVVEVDAWVKANRTAGAVGGVVSAALVAVALQALVKAW